MARRLILKCPAACCNERVGAGWYNDSYVSSLVTETLGGRQQSDLLCAPQDSGHNILHRV
ncbi:hypothetical protein BofuT4_uP028310.1 [Botrytis cinerea T4]|uniref:Uncharacterized protein n=1 Tax=Botryotinia fuckeliana (strain T4) TaxID=999810 RepID=G2Y9T8_BOTF4|nr:hypothetical protein BofuT4_uP028310.1 [Botrytis cinerea T4]